jgi:hypothetical protein
MTTAKFVGGNFTIVKIPKPERVISVVSIIGFVLSAMNSSLNQNHNQTQQSDLVKLSPFLKKHSKKPPTSPSRCAQR